MDITRNLNGARALVVGAGLALALAMGAAPTPALAEGRIGTTDVTIRTEIDNIMFKAPTVIPFVAKADGTLQGPSEGATTIDNLSAYGIHVTNMKIGAQNSWNIVADAKTGTAQNSIDFKVGPDQALQDAHAAAGAEIEDLAASVLLGVLDRAQMALGKIDDVDIIAHAGAVRGVIVVAENIHVAPLPVGDLKHQRYKVGLRVVRLAYIALRVRPAGVEVTQRDKMQVMGQQIGRAHV